MIEGCIDDKTYYRYALDVANGKIVAGEHVRLACKRFLWDLKRDDMTFSVVNADRVIEFIGIMRHSVAQFAGKPFILLPWQQWVVANIYGFHWPDGTRRFTTAYIEIARKNGKTQLAAGLGLYSLVGEGESGAQVICAANSKEQASILLGAANSLAQSIDPREKYIWHYRYELSLPSTKSFLRIVSADTSKLDGLNCSAFIIDEYHEARDTRMWDVLKSSQGMRKNPLGIVITTAGFNKEGPCYAKRSVGVDVLHGLKKDDTMFCAVYALDDGDDWTDEANWLKCCPCLDVTVSRKYMREQVHSARLNPSEEVGVKTKNLNLWTDVADVWIPDSYITRSCRDIALEDFAGCPCYVGVDLASTSDITAVSYMVERDGKFHFLNDYYVPGAALQEKTDKEQYRLWRQQGLLKVTDGNVTDYTVIEEDLLRAAQVVSIRSIAFDRWNAGSWSVSCTEKGLPLEEFSQTIGNFNKPTRELERIVLSGNAVIGNNEITRWMFRNVSLREDSNGNVKPAKGRKRERKIDGVIAMIQALGVYLLMPHYSNSITIL